MEAREKREPTKHRLKTQMQLKKMTTLREETSGPEHRDKLRGDSHPESTYSDSQERHTST